MYNTSYLYNFGCGIAAGSSAAFVSHPFLRIKTELQNDGKVIKIKNNLMTNTRFIMTTNIPKNGINITKIENINRSWLYKGLIRAMCNYSLEKMLVFGVYNSLKSHDFNSTTAGAIAGFIASFTIAPGEQLVNDARDNVRNFKLKHLFKGLPSTILREMIGFSVHLTVYDYLMSNFNSERKIPKTIGCVSLAIIAGWGVVTPIDRIKTQIQSDTFNIKTYEFSRSFVGFRFALMRALPFHITSFLMMEYLMDKKKDMLQF